MTGHPDWQGTGLVHGIDLLAGPNATVTLTPGQSRSVPILFAKPGYVVSMFASIGAGAGIPFCQVDLEWEDATSSVVLDFQTWIIPAVSSGGYTMRGSGPVRGPLGIFTFTNLDGGNNMTVTYSVIETTQHIARDDWRGPLGRGFGAVPNYTLANSNISAGILQAVPPTAGNTVPANSTITYLLPLYCGPMQLSTTAAANIAISVRVPNQLPAVPYGGQGAGGIGAANWIDLTLTDVTVQLNFPRVPMVLGMTNNTGAAIAFSQLLNILEQVS